MSGTLYVTIEKTIINMLHKEGEAMSSNYPEQNKPQGKPQNKDDSSWGGCLTFILIIVCGVFLFSWWNNRKGGLKEQIQKNIDKRDTEFSIRKNRTMKNHGEWEHALDICFKSDMDPNILCIKDISCYKDGSTIKMKVTYLCDPEEEKEWKEDLEKETDSIIQSLHLHEITDDWEKIRRIHDYLVSTITYEENDYESSVYGGLVKKRCVCAGYAASFNYLAQKVGIDSEIQTGYPTKMISLFSTTSDFIKPSGHAWNKMTFDGTDYIMDVGWDDPDETDKNGKPYIIYDYFMTSPESVKGRMTYEEIENYDSEKDDLTVPTDKVTKEGPYNFHVHEGLYMESYDRNTMKTMLKRYFKKNPSTNILTVRLGSADAGRDSAKDLNNSDKRWDIIGSTGYKGSSYRYNDAAPVLMKQEPSIWNFYLYPKD